MLRRQFLRTATLGGAGLAATGLAAPAIAQARREMTVVSTWGRDFPGLGTSAQRLCNRINQVSDGRINVTYFAAGERVGAFDVFDEVAGGNSDAYIGADYYFIGKHPGYAYFTTVPFGMVNGEWNAWIKFGGGQALWDELHGQFGLKAYTCGATGTQAGGWFNKEIETPDDLRGLKMRIPGLAGTVMSKLGVSTIAVPGGQIFENLVSGAVDAAEWVGPFNDYFLKLYEAAKFYYTAGMHEPGGGIAFAMNANFFGGLSDWEKAVIESCCYEENANQPEEAMALNGQYLTRLVKDHGVQVRNFSDEVWDAFGEAAEATFEEVRSHSPMAAKIDDSFQSALREIGTMLSVFEVGYVNQRNRVLGIV